MQWRTCTAPDRLYRCFIPTWPVREGFVTMGGAKEQSSTSYDHFLKSCYMDGVHVLDVPIVQISTTVERGQLPYYERIRWRSVSTVAGTSANLVSAGTGRHRIL